MTEQVTEAKKLEKEAVNLAEKGEVGKAIDIFNEIIAIQPNLSSAYNNRAQAYRLMGNDDSK